MPLLTKDYIRIKKMFKEFEEFCKKEDAERKETLAVQICQALTASAQVEEEIFYPLVREAIYDDVLMKEAMVESATAKDLIAQIKSMRVSDPLYDAVVAALSEFVNHPVAKMKSFPSSKKMKPQTLDLAILLHSYAVNLCFLLFSLHQYCEMKSYRQICTMYGLTDAQTITKER